MLPTSPLTLLEDEQVAGLWELNWALLLGGNVEGQKVNQMH